MGKEKPDFLSTTYTRAQVSNHPISKVLQWLPRYTGLWAGWGLGHMFQSWGRFFLCPWHYVCQFSAKNLIGHDLWNVSKKITTSIEVKIAIKNFLIKSFSICVLCTFVHLLSKTWLREYEWQYKPYINLLLKILIFRS